MMQWLLVGAGEIIILLAAISDYRTKEVYRALWIPANVSFLAAGFLCGNIDIYSCLFLGFYWLLQSYLFSRFYGRADCRAFFSCSLAAACITGHMTNILVDAFFHMSLAYLLLIFAQLIKRNIKAGKLLQEVAFVPYIAISHYFCLFFFLFS